MRRRRTRVLGVLVAVAMAALTFQFGGGPIPEAGAATIGFTCRGANNDRAGTIGGQPKTSAQLLGLLNPSNPAVSLPVGMTVAAPAQVKKGAPPFGVRVNISVNVDPSLAATVKQTLGKSFVDIKNARFVVEATNGGGTIAGQIPDTRVFVDRANPTQAITGTVNPVNTGRMNYVPRSASLQIAINGSVAGGAAVVGTLTMSCATSGDSAGSTLVTVPGAPIPADIRVKGHWGINLWNVLGTPGWIRPDNNNPIIPSSLKITRPMPRSFGLVATKDGWLGMLTGPMGGVRTVGMNVCAGSLTIPAEPGSNEKFNFGFPESGWGKFNNRHITGFKLKVGDHETAAISSSRTANPLAGFPGQPANYSTVLTDSIDANVLLVFPNSSLVTFTAPSATLVQQRLEALPNIGAGNVKVTLADPIAEGAPASYDIEFVGALSEVDMPDVQVSRVWGHWPPALLQQILDLANELGEDGGEEPAEPVSPETLLTQLFTGQISGDQFAAGIAGALVAGLDVNAALDGIQPYFPASPRVERTQPAVETIPARQTGPLCTPFEFRAQNDPVPLNLVLFFTFLANRAAGRA